ncbi:AAA family ATPase [Mesorhizobium sp. WSM2239]|uniref:AAA family ATPase n=2 Tax=unclassified Mesorhizobium TaxID=325217 RepID=A0AAU8D2S2_9HYPH
MNPNISGAPISGNPAAFAAPLPMQPAAPPLPVPPMPVNPIAPQMPPLPMKPGPIPMMPMQLMPSMPPLPPPVEWIVGSELQGPPPVREWLVGDMIPMNTVTLLYGDGGTGKSLLALQLAAAMALGRIWLNRVPMHGRTVYVSAEDDRAELHRRLAIIAGSHNATTADLAGITIADMAGKDALLAHVIAKKGILKRTELLNQIEVRIAMTAPRLVVVDTLADAFPGNENDRAMVRQFVGMMRGLAIKHRCAVVLLAHPSLTGINTGTGASGSTAWNNSVRSRLYFERIKEGDYEPNPDARQLKVMKSNYGRVGIEIAVAWKGGIFIAEQDGGIVDANPKAERVFLKLLALFSTQGRDVNPSAGPNYAPAVFAKHHEAEGCSKRTLKDAMERLLSAGKIVVSIKKENGHEKRYLDVN